jgi:hypothetical protein
LACYYLGQSSTGQQLIRISYSLKIGDVISQYSIFLKSTQIYTQEKNTITLAISSSSALNTHTDIIPQPQIITGGIYIRIPECELSGCNILFRLNRITPITRSNLIVLITSAYKTRHLRAGAGRGSCGRSRRSRSGRNSRHSHANVISKPEIIASGVYVGIPECKLSGGDVFGCLD